MWIVDCDHELFVLCAEIECQFSHTVEINERPKCITIYHGEFCDFVKSKKQKHWRLDFATCTLVLKRNFISNMQTKAKLNNFLFRKTMKTSKIELMRSNLPMQPASLRQYIFFPLQHMALECIKTIVVHCIDAVHERNNTPMHFLIKIQFSSFAFFELHFRQSWIASVFFSARVKHTYASMHIALAKHTQRPKIAVCGIHLEAAEY